MGSIPKTKGIEISYLIEYPQCFISSFTKTSFTIKIKTEKFWPHFLLFHPHRFTCEFFCFSLLAIFQHLHKTHYPHTWILNLYVHICIFFFTYTKRNELHFCIHIFALYFIFRRNRNQSTHKNILLLLAITIYNKHK